MDKVVGIKEASRITDLKEWELRIGCKNKKHPHITVGFSNKKIFFNQHLLMKSLGL